MEKKERLTSVSDAAAILADDEEVKNQVEKEIEYSQLVNTLIQMRVCKKKTQKELALLMGCDPSKISRMEAGNDLQLKMGDVIDYASVLGVSMSLMFEDTSLPAASQIKQHVFAVQEQLEKLVTVAKEVDGDEEIVTKIHVFCGEVLFNFLRKFGDSYDQLCKASGRVVPVIKAVELKQEKAESEEHSCC